MADIGKIVVMIGMLAFRNPAEPESRFGLRIFLGLLYLVAGVFHVLKPAPFLTITPHWVPQPEAVILITGLCELAGAVALLFIPRLQAAAAMAFALYGVCVYPANINHAVQDQMGGPHALGLWYHVPRLLLQPVLVWAALYAGAVISWPFASKAKG